MAQIETQGILQDIETLVSDQLQVVSYKWLSRNYLVSSNDAKRLLQEFVENHGNGLEVVYSLSGQLKSNPLSYHVRLVSGPQLAEAKEEFDGNCSIGLYSVQPSIPKDPATMWNTEFVQSEELHMQAPTVENCLRDNRFCDILNSFVMRNVEGPPLSTSPIQLKTKLVEGPSKSNLAPQNSTHPNFQPNKGEQSSPKVGLQAPNVVKDAKIERHGTIVDHHTNKPPADKEKVLPLPGNKRKLQNDKSSLANMWGRASAKSKSISTAENDNSVSNHTGASAEAQICAKEVVPGFSSDDDDPDVSFKRVSNCDVARKRRAVFDFSDDEECEDAVDLASPEYPKEKLCQDLKESTKAFVPDKTKLNFDEEMPIDRDSNQPCRKVKSEVREENEDMSIDKDSNQPCREDSSIDSKWINAGILQTGKLDTSVPKKDVNKMDKPVADKTQRHVPEKDVNKVDKPISAASRSPQRKKVLKTRIDERGREVTEVIWEGKETEAKKADSSTTTKADSSTTTKADSSTTKKADNTVATASNRPPAAQKSVGNTGPKQQTSKVGGKKGGNKDPKQGNILSFFKKV